MPQCDLQFGLKASCMIQVSRGLPPSFIAPSQMKRAVLSERI